MEYLACPSCGSTYFMSSRKVDKLVFHVSFNHQPIVVKQPQDIGIEPDINVSQICCGACSWTGKVNQLLTSHM
jgi:hypothetical protein